MHDIMYVYICIYIYLFICYCLTYTYSLIDADTYTYIHIYIYSHIHIYIYIYIHIYIDIHIYTHVYIYIYIHMWTTTICKSCRTVLGSLDFHGFSTWCWLKRTVIHPDLIAISCMNVKFSEDISWRLSELAPKISQKKEIAMFYEYV